MSDVKQVIARSYDHNPSGFARLADRLVYRHLAAPLARALEDAGGPVLDVATGTGALGRLLSRSVGIDLSRRLLTANPLEKLVCGDAERLPFRAGAFAAAGCAFGINHFPEPEAAVTEMARVAARVGLLTWERPEVTPHAPKVAMLDAIAAHTGQAHTEAGRIVDDMSEHVGSEDAVRALLESAGVDAHVVTVTVEVPWPGTAAFVDYRLAMHSGELTREQRDAIARDARRAVDALPGNSRRWRARLVLGTGARSERGHRT
jgi:ubiquinone/menaquinone biosynthesis C-methylase UbiE